MSKMSLLVLIPVRLASAGRALKGNWKPDFWWSILKAKVNLSLMLELPFRPAPFFSGGWGKSNKI
jgi:hypothetical protein